MKKTSGHPWSQTTKNRSSERTGPVWGLPTVGTKTWNSLLKQPVESLNEALCADRKRQFDKEYPFQKVVLAAFLSQFMRI
jgi:hypothetical protein